MEKLISFFDKHTSNVTSGQKIVNEMMTAANVKTSADADKVREAYRKHLDGNKNAQAILAVFNVRMNRWMQANKVAPKARQGGLKAKAKAAPVPAKAAPVIAKGSPAATLAKAGAATLQAVTLESLETGLRSILSNRPRADIVSIQARFKALFDNALKSAK